MQRGGIIHVHISKRRRLIGQFGENAVESALSVMRRTAHAVASMALSGVRL